MKLYKTVIFLSLLTVGCSGSNVPSESEIKQTMQSMFSKCEPMTIESVKKTNGHPLENGRYLVEFDFKVVLAPLDENKALGKEYLEHMEKVPEARETYAESSKEIEQILKQQQQEERAWSENARVEVAAELKKVLGVSGELDPRIFQRSYNGEFNGLNQGMIEASYYRKFRGFSDDRPFSEMPPEINEINERYKKERETAYEAIINKHSERLKALQAENEKAEKILRGTTFGQNERLYFSEQARNVFKACHLNDKYSRDIANQALGITIGNYSEKDIKRLMIETEIEFTSTLEMIKTEKGWMAS